MENKGTVSETVQDREMLENVDYYKYIFKKTEKIAGAVFYITYKRQDIAHEDRVVKDLESTTQRLLNVSLESLKSTQATIEEKALDIRHLLVVVESRLRIAHAARLIDGPLLEVFIHELNSVQRSLKKYLELSVQNPLNEESGVYPERPVRERRIGHGKADYAHGGEVKSLMHPVRSRRERVVDVLKDKGDATIKDIMEIIKDCSEKTIQRELTGLIKDNIVVREGERRWSKYKLV